MEVDKAEQAPSLLQRMFPEPSSECAIAPLDVCEVKALLKYASERGIDADSAVVKPLLVAVQAYDALPADSEDPGVALQRREQTTTMVVLYTQLAKLTNPVTGRSVLDTEREFAKALRPLYLWTFFFLLAVITNEILRVWFGDMPEAEEGPLRWALDVQRYVLGVFEPFLWGGLGSCVYILKRLSDVAEERTFDRSTSRGWITRILLGAILGGVVQYLYDPEAFLGGGLKLGANALGFLTGVGVKVVYGAIEKTIETLGEKLNLSTLKTQKKGADALRIFLAEQLAKIDKDKEPAKRAAVQSLLDEVADKPPAGSP